MPASVIHFSCFTFLLHSHANRFIRTLSFSVTLKQLVGFPDGSMVNNPPCNARNVGSIPGSGKPPGGGNDNSLQYSSLKISVARGSWRAKIHEELQRERHDLTTKQ